MSSKTQSAQNSLRPLAFWPSLLYFGLPAAVFVFGFHVIMPSLIAQGWIPFQAYAISLGLPLAGLLVAALTGFYREGHPLTCSAFRNRFRLHRMSGRDWLWTLAAVVVAFLGYGVMSIVSASLMAGNLIPLPDDLPSFVDPRAAVRGVVVIEEGFGGLRGNWWGLAAYFVFLFFNIVGEEFWWRGYLLPRQEIALGSKTWLVHGAAWAVFHIFKWWDVLNLLPVTLILTALVLRRRNNTPGIVFHYVFNGLALIPIFIAVLGIGG